jgi:putative membrane protein
VLEHDYDFDGRDARADSRLWKGVIAGAAGGLIASWAMSRLPKPSAQPSEQEQDDATVKTASAISQGVAGHQLTNDEKRVGGPLVHYAFGTMMGAMYGGVAEVWPDARTGWGLPFGAALWFGADEVAVPSLGLGSKPTETPAPMHAYALAAHLVYGLTADLTRRGVRAML